MILSQKSEKSLYFEGGILIPMDGTSPRRGSLEVRGSRLHSVGELPDSALPRDRRCVDASGCWLLPAFTQTHVHLVQALFRGLADDLPLLRWLHERVWPLEAAHDAESTYWSARLGLTELLLSGTTSILDMAMVRHTDSVFQAASECGVRLISGPAMMDRPNRSGLWRSTREVLDEACRIAATWHRKDRLEVAFCPRFVPSCTEELLRETCAEARARGCLIHTHTSENLDELKLVRALTGRDNVVYLNDIGMTGPDVGLAHCVHLSPRELAILVETGTRVLHCPSSNLKLGSGIAPIPELLAAGAHVSLGADGAPCNNRLDMFREMWTAANIQKARLGASIMPAANVLEMATLRGAEALGAGNERGRLLKGLQADIVVLDPRRPAFLGGGDPIASIVYALDASAVREVWIAGEQVVGSGRVLAWNTEETIQGAILSLRRVLERAGIPHSAASVVGDGT